MKTIAIIQARTGSTRLPGKVLFDLAGKPVLEHVIRRVSHASLVNKVIIATTINPQDQKIVELCKKLEVSFYCGSENDVLDRYYQAALLSKPDNVVRITADCPMIDPKIIDKVIKKHNQEQADYTANAFEETFPDGEDVEVIAFTALVRVWKQAQLASEREHVTLYIRNHPQGFKIMSFKNREDLSSKRWTLDSKEDYVFLGKIFQNLYFDDPFFGMEKILSFLREHPELEKINSHIERNAGLKKSLKEDRIVR